MGDNNALLIKGSVFVKFQKSCIIEKTQQGSIYMNSLQQFRKLYKDSGDETIGDPYEGKLYIYNADCFIPDKENVIYGSYALGFCTICVGGVALLIAIYNECSVTSLCEY